MAGEQPKKATQVLLFLVLLAGVCLTLSRFISPIVWATALVLATWPVYRRLKKALPDRPWAAPGIMTLTFVSVLLAVVVPVAVTITAEIGNSGERLKNWLSKTRAMPPEWLTDIPYIGTWLGDRAMYFKRHSQDLVNVAEQYQKELLQFITIAAQGIAETCITIGAWLLIMFFLYRYGTTLKRQILVAGAKLGGRPLCSLVVTIGLAVRSIVYGTLVTAAVQGALAGVGYYFAAAPFPFLLSLLTAFLSILPYGTPVAYVPVTILVASQQGLFTGVLLAAWCTIVVSSSDNLLRPFLISKAIHLPWPLVFLGIVGGVYEYLYPPFRISLAYPSPLGLIWLFC